MNLHLTVKQAERTQIVAALIAYVLVVVGLWGYYGLYNGFPDETVLIFTSDQQTGWKGFLYIDPLRKFTSLFYHLSYVLGRALGVSGSFVPYQLVYAALWVFRAFLTFLIVRELLPHRPALALLAGLTVALHTGDASLNWVGQLHHPGFVFWMLLSFLFFIYAVKSEIMILAAAWSAGAVLSVYLCLWSYESPLPVTMAFPVAVAMVLRPLDLRRFAMTTTGYAIPVIIFVVKNVNRYMSGGGKDTYQAGVVRDDFSFVSIGYDLLYHLEHSVSFWAWPYSGLKIPFVSEYVLAFMPVIAAILFLVPLAIRAEEREPRPFRADRRLFLFGLASFLLLVASYLVALILRYNRVMFRTEFLPSFAASCLVAALLYVLLAQFRNTRIRVFIAVMIFSIVGIFATECGVNSGRFERALWDRTRILMASIIRQAPAVADGTLFVVRGLPYPIAHHRHHNMWFDMALRLAYPSKKIAGIYFLDSGAPAPGANLVPGQEVRLLPEGFPTWFHLDPTAKVRYVLVFDTDASTGEAMLVREGPVKIGDSVLSAADYKPCAALVGPTPDPMAMRRYGPITTFQPASCALEKKP